AWARLTDIGVDYFSWADGGKTITWALGSSFSRRPMSSVDFSASSQSQNVGAVPRDLDPAVRRQSIDMEFPRATPEGAILLRHVNAITMEEEGVIRDADILIVGNHINAIGPSGSIAAPPGILEKDLGGRFVMPGFVDTHAHWYTLKRYNLLEPQSWDLMANL